MNKLEKGSSEMVLKLIREGKTKALTISEMVEKLDISIPDKVAIILEIHLGLGLLAGNISRVLLDEK